MRATNHNQTAFAMNMRKLLERSKRTDEQWLPINSHSHWYNMTFLMISWLKYLNCVCPHFLWEQKSRNPLEQLKQRRWSRISYIFSSHQCSCCCSLLIVNIINKLWMFSDTISVHNKVNDSEEKRNLPAIPKVFSSEWERRSGKEIKNWFHVMHMRCKPATAAQQYGEKLRLLLRYWRNDASIVVFL